jgi:hypothetical protein
VVQMKKPTTLIKSPAMQYCLLKITRKIQYNRLKKFVEFFILKYTLPASVSFSEVNSSASCSCSTVARVSGRNISITSSFPTHTISILQILWTAPQWLALGVARSFA